MRKYQYHPFDVCWVCGRITEDNPDTRCMKRTTIVRKEIRIPCPHVNFTKILDDDPIEYAGIAQQTLIHDSRLEGLQVIPNEYTKLVFHTTIIIEDDIQQTISTVTDTDIAIYSHIAKMVKAYRKAIPSMKCEVGFSTEGFSSIALTIKICNASNAAFFPYHPAVIADHCEHYVSGIVHRTVSNALDSALHKNSK